MLLDFSQDTRTPVPMETHDPRSSSSTSSTFSFPGDEDENAAAMVGLPTPSQAALLKIDIGALLGPDFVPMANDILRMVCIQVAIQAMMVLAGGGGETRFFSAEFLMLVFYIALGVMLYWLAVRKLMIFT
jgi:hypothetical protein